jgi:hypothetical protein
MSIRCISRQIHGVASLPMPVIQRERPELSAAAAAAAAAAAICCVFLGASSR